MMLIPQCAVGLVLLLVSAGATSETQLAKRSKCWDAARKLVNQMTVEEKADQLNSASSALPRLGIPAFNFWSESLHGYLSRDDQLGATIFPTNIGLGATFDTELIHEVATAISDEMRAYYNLHPPMAVNAFGPNINIFRDPRWGRGLEVYSEDPRLTAAVAVAYVRGLQGNHSGYVKVGATCKHFAAYSLEAADGVTRHSYDARVDDRDLAETYLPAFEACVREARATSIMCSYNSLNGAPTCGNHHLLSGILRKQWGFKGMVVSDCGAVSDIMEGHHVARTMPEAVSVAITAGNDLFCDGAYDQIPAAVHQGLLNETALDAAVTRALELRCSVGALTHKPPKDLPWGKLGRSVIGSPRHLRLARTAAEQSLVLLVNREVAAWGGRRALPLDPAMFKAARRGHGNNGDSQEGGQAGSARGWKLGAGKLAVIGPLADSPEHLLGNYVGYPAGGADATVQTPLQAIRELLCSAGSSGKPGEGEQRAAWLRRDGAARRLAAGQAGSSSSSLLGRGAEQGHGMMQAEQGDVGTVQAPENSGSGGAGGLEGDGVCLVYSQGIPTIQTQNLDGLSGSVTDVLARQDVAAGVLFVGGSVLEGGDSLSRVRTEGEGLDRGDLRLTWAQEQLVRAADRAGKPLVLVLLQGGPIDIGPLLQLPNVAAVLSAWMPGQQGAAAIADALFGRVSPSGRLPVSTLHNNYTEQSHMSDMSMRKWPGRTYRYLQVPPLFEFGHGLSYARVTYANLALHPCDWAAAGPDSAAAGSDGAPSLEDIPACAFKVSVEVTHAGWVQEAGPHPATAGEVVMAQLHRDPGAYGPDPPSRKQLLAFSRVTLAPGETRRVELVLPARWMMVGRGHTDNSGELEEPLAAEGSGSARSDTDSNNRDAAKEPDDQRPAGPTEHGMQAEAVSRQVSKHKYPGLKWVPGPATISVGPLTLEVHLPPGDL
mmetsp:Transcript_20723/g.52624  ORF Transcript_20723/g.52624 Transcript_20723/m.52624 type:complete len:939 (-) Transcript_20723:211-3027(-)